MSYMIYDWIALKAEYMADPSTNLTISEFLRQKEIPGGGTHRVMTKGWRQEKLKMLRDRQEKITAQAEKKIIRSQADKLARAKIRQASLGANIMKAIKNLLKNPEEFEQWFNLKDQGPIAVKRKINGSDLASLARALRDAQDAELKAYESDSPTGKNNQPGAGQDGQETDINRVLSSILEARGEREAD